MGLPEDQLDLQGALHQAVLEDDLAELEEGLTTVVGTKAVVGRSIKLKLNIISNQQEVYHGN